MFTEDQISEISAMGNRLALLFLSFVLTLLAAHSSRAQTLSVPVVSISEAIDLGAKWAEITTVAMGPGEHPSCPNGRLFFASSKKVLATTLDGEPESLASNPWIASFNET